MTTKNEMYFLKSRARKDSPEIDSLIKKTLMETHFYYIDDNLQGWFIPLNVDNLSDIEVIIHSNLKDKKEIA